MPVSCCIYWCTVCQNLRHRCLASRGAAAGQGACAAAEPFRRHSDGVAEPVIRAAGETLLWLPLSMLVDCCADTWRNGHSTADSSHWHTDASLEHLPYRARRSLGSATGGRSASPAGGSSDSSSGASSERARRPAAAQAVAPAQAPAAAARRRVHALAVANSGIPAASGAGSSATAAWRSGWAAY